MVTLHILHYFITITNTILQQNYLRHTTLRDATELTDGPLLIQTPLGKAVHQLDLVVLVSATSGRLEDLYACRELDVVLVVIAPGCQRELKLAVKLG